MRTLQTLPLLAVALACAKPASTPAAAPAAVMRPEDAPAAFQPGIARALGAMGALRDQLQQRLLQEVSANGPAAAVSVCRDEAPAIAARLSSEQRLELGRSSHKLRNPANAPRPWVAPLLAQAAGRKAAEVPASVVDLGDRIGVVRPIAVAAPCTVCHGEKAELNPEVAARLAAEYPEDAATGFAPGDFRGFFWAEVAK